MLRGGLIRQSAAGIYNYLPLAVKALRKLETLIDNEMTRIEGTKLCFASLTPSHLWKKSGRWDEMGDELWRISDRKKTDFCLGPTHEEIVTDLVASEIQSYKQLPLRLYQITTKFRDEMRPRSGLLRGREFIMKDMYTFDAAEDGALLTYDLVCNAYERILKQLEVPFIKVEGDVGQIGGSMSHEFHIPSECGEDHVITCASCGVSINEAMIIGSDGARQSVIPGCQQAQSCQSKGQKAIEVGHAFYLGSKYSNLFHATFMDDNKEKHVVQMGCFGIGVSRLLQACIEVLSPSSGDRIVWPSKIAPYQVCIVPLGMERDGSALRLKSQAEALYDTLNSSGVSTLDTNVIIDDRVFLSAGVRLADVRLVGYPFLVVLGNQTLNSGLLELQIQYTGETEYLSLEALVDKLRNCLL
jgi:prolyl-tRNA synthetase